MSGDRRACSVEPLPRAGSIRRDGEQPGPLLNGFAGRLFARSHAGFACYRAGIWNGSGRRRAAHQEPKPELSTDASEPPWVFESISESPLLLSMLTYRQIKCCAPFRSERAAPAQLDPAAARTITDHEPPDSDTHVSTRHLDPYPPRK
jgi:hypothetical protein